MADYTCRALRDGTLEYELATSLLIKDSILSPLAFHLFNYILSQISSFILAGTSQSRGIVIVAISRSPEFYVDLLKKSGFDDVAFGKLVRILDCYSDPLGWKRKLKESGQISSCPESSSRVTVFRDVRNLDGLFSRILELGKDAVGEGTDRFCIGIDSVTELLRDVPLSSVATLLSNIRSNGQVSSAFWLLHSDLHNASTNAALDYICSITANVEAVIRHNVSLFEQSVRRAMLRVRLKRRTGRVKLMSEEIHVEQSGVRFLPPSSEEESMAQALVPKLQFNLQLSEKEQLDRSKVVLPFEHQEKHKANQIYDGRRSLVDGQNEIGIEAGKSPVIENAGKGEIVYLRDSDDERPDSDEDPDDDLDI